jgi:hypothetical protein
VLIPDVGEEVCSANIAPREGFGESLEAEEV